MRILVVSDVDDLYWRHGSGQADLLLACGDLSDQLIIGAAKAYGCKNIFAVKGNHDSPHPFEFPIEDLHLRHRDFMGVRFGGLAGSWKYKPRGNFLFEQWEVNSMLEGFPPVDLFISHNSPKGIHDKPDGVHDGFEGLNNYMNIAGPKLLIHGHQHVNSESMCAETRVIGVHGWRVLDI